MKIFFQILEFLICAFWFFFFFINASEMLLHNKEKDMWFWIEFSALVIFIFLIFFFRYRYLKTKKKAWRISFLSVSFFLPILVVGFALIYANLKQTIYTQSFSFEEVKEGVSHEIKRRVNEKINLKNPIYTYYEDGSVHTMIETSDGTTRNGGAISFYPNGTIQYHWRFDNDTINGKLFCYDENEDLVAVVDYAKGIPIDTSYYAPKSKEDKIDR
ncbi:MAG: hypothetical protein LBR81_10315 [Prevotellaceae bacterium]|jgi:hypothetical protein|nr:hypothetical protein [Prevotellaceae bacterium]